MIVEARPAIRGRLREEAKARFIPLSIPASVVPKYRKMQKKKKKPRNYPNMGRMPFEFAIRRYIFIAEVSSASTKSAVMLLPCQAATDN